MQYDCSFHNKGYSWTFDLKVHELQYNHQLTTLSKEKKEQSVSFGASETSVSGKYSEVGSELSVMTNDSNDLRKNVSRDKSLSVERSNIKLYYSFRFQFTECSKKFSYYTVLAAHMLNHKKEMFKCTYCVQNFCDNVELQKHVLETHPNIAQTTHMAVAQEFQDEAAVMLDANCGKLSEAAVMLGNNDGKLNEVLNPSALQSVSAQNSNTCRECGPTSPMKITYTEQSYMSDDKSGDDLSISQASNSGRGKTSTKRSSMCDTNYSLIKVTKKMEGDRNDVICHICGKYFQQKYGLICHLQSVHERRRDFKCSFCKKGFSEKIGRDEHERIHMGEKPYSCDLCDKAFRAMALLYILEKYHFKSHGSYRFQCPKKFSFQSALTKHMRKHKESDSMSVLSVPKVPIARLILQSTYCIAILTQQ